MTFVNSISGDGERGGGRGREADGEAGEELQDGDGRGGGGERRPLPRQLRTLLDIASP